MGRGMKGGGGGGGTVRVGVGVCGCLLFQAKPDASIKCDPHESPRRGPKNHRMHAFQPHLWVCERVVCVGGVAVCDDLAPGTTRWRLSQLAAPREPPPPHAHAHPTPLCVPVVCHTACRTAAAPAPAPAPAARPKPFSFSAPAPVAAPPPAAAPAPPASKPAPVVAKVEKKAAPKVPKGRGGGEGGAGGVAGEGGTHACSVTSTPVRAWQLERGAPGVAVVRGTRAWRGVPAWPGMVAGCSQQSAIPSAGAAACTTHT